MSGNETTIRMKASPDGRLVPTMGDRRYVDFHIKVDALLVADDRSARPSITLSLVLDRSGSMHGLKVETAKRAALQVLDQLTDRDRASLVVFDDRIDVLLPASPVTPQVRDEIRARLSNVAARGSTALHEGWLTGAQTIADDGSDRQGAPARILLLTDGLANVGKIDPEEIAAETAQVLSRAGIVTSTFGIGEDYDEGLLGPMAVAGGGQFHHLRSSEEMLATFSGELGALLDTAVTQVSLEIETDLGIEVEPVSAYWLDKTSSTNTVVRIGDLPANEERHVVISATFPASSEGNGRRVRARVVWTDTNGARRGEWQTVQFTYADSAAVQAEARDPEVVRWAGLHESARARQEASLLRRRGLSAQASARLREAGAGARKAAAFAPDMAPIAHELDDLAAEMDQRQFTSDELKELRFRSQTFSRGQRDLRRSDDSEKK